MRPKPLLQPPSFAVRAFSDSTNYFGILLDDNSRKPICRLHFNRAKKYIEIFGENTPQNSQGSKLGTKHEIQSPDDINAFAEKLIACVMHYEQKGDQESQTDGDDSDV